MAYINWLLLLSTIYHLEGTMPGLQDFGEGSGGDVAEFYVYITEE